MIEQPIVQIKCLHPEALIPRYMTELAAGMDIHALPPDTIELRPGERCLVPTGIALAIPPGFEVQVRPRSGLAVKHGVTLLPAEMDDVKDLDRIIYEELMARCSPRTCIYFCMESDEIWQEVMGFRPTEKGGIGNMLDQAAGLR